MNYEELQEELKKRGVDISVITLRRYVKNGLIPEPERKHYGRGKGEHVNFPLEAIAETAAAKEIFRLKRNPSVEIVKEARDLALKSIREGSTVKLLEGESNLLPRDYEIRTLAFEWLRYYFLIKDGHDLKTPGYWNADNNGFIRFVADPEEKGRKILEELKALLSNPEISQKVIEGMNTVIESSKKKLENP